jgi:hypothetical protein
MQIDSKINLIDTEGLAYSSDIDFEFSNLTFDNIKFATSGNLLKLDHHFSSELIVRDSSFTNLDSARILIGTSSSQLEKTRVKFINNKFNSFYSESSSLISIYNQAIVELQNCSFTNLHTLSFGAAITAGASKANVIVSDSKFTNNSAAEGSVFNINSESTIRCNN